MRIVLSGWFICLVTLAMAGPPGSARFIQNKNQWPSAYAFGAQVPSGNLFFSEERILFSFSESPRSLQTKNGSAAEVISHHESGFPSETLSAHVYEIRFLNALKASIRGENKLITTYNYFLGNDQSKWASNVPSYGAVYYERLYQGIDMRYYSENENLKYEWIVSPQSDPSDIQMQYNGVNTISLDNGNLHIKTSLNEIWEMQPYAYQVINGVTVSVPCHYVLKGNVLSYQFPGGYDECEELIIDPILIFSAYSGSTLDNWGNTATYDDRGNVYSGGMVSNPGNFAGFPVTLGAYQKNSGGGQWDVGILKYDSAGTKLLYCTYLGGTDTETPQSLVVNEQGDLFILGATGSSDFPGAVNTFSGGTQIDPLGGVIYSNGSDLFIASLNAEGNQLLGARYFGGTKNDGVNFISGNMFSAARSESPLARNYGDQLRGDIITDADGFVYIASNTLSADFPVTGISSPFAGGSHDAVVAKFNADLTGVIWSRFIGGTGTDAAYSIKIDSDKNIFLAGGTNSPTLPGMNGVTLTNRGGIDGWIISMNPSGEILNGTFLGTTQYDQCYFIDFDNDQNLFAYGQTMGNYPVTGSVYSNARGGQFIHKFSHDLKTTMLSTVIGSGGNTPNISPTAFLVSDCGYVYLSGWGGSVNSTNIVVDGEVLTRNYVGGTTTNMPVTQDAYQRTTLGSDFYLMVLAQDATTLLYATFLGGNSSSTHVDGGTSRFDKRGMVYHSVCAGCGGVSDFPAVNVPAAHRLNKSRNCNNAVFKFDLSVIRARLQTNTENLRTPRITAICFPDKIVFQNFSIGAITYEWNFGDGTILNTDKQDNITHQYAAPGVYNVTLKAFNAGTCIGVDVANTRIFVNTINATVPEDSKICKGTTIDLTASGAAQYEWMDDKFDVIFNGPVLPASPRKDTRYFLKLKSSNGCITYDTVDIKVIDPINVDFLIERQSDCSENIPVLFVKNLTDSLAADDILEFHFGDGKVADFQEGVHTFEKSGQYNVTLIAVRDICVTEKVIPVNFSKIKIPNVITPAIKDGQNDTFIIQFGDNANDSPAKFGFPVEMRIYDRWGKLVFETNDYQNNWSGNDLSGGVYYYQVNIAEHDTCKGWVHLVK